MKKKTPIVSTLTLCTSRASWAAFVLSVGFFIMAISLGKFQHLEDRIFYDTEDQWIIDKCAWNVLKSAKGRLYLRGMIDGKRVLLHRFILGVTDRKIQIDHKDANGLNNKRNNIRVATKNQNMWNRRLNSNNTTGFKGVSYYKKDDNFKANINKNGARICLGTFKTAIGAAIAYNKAAVIHHAEFCLLNSIP